MVDVSEPYVSKEETPSAKKAWIIVGVVVAIVVILIAVYFFIKSGQASSVDRARFAVSGY